VTLTPHPFGALLRRAFRELPARNALFDLPSRRFFRGDPRRDLSVAFHTARPATPFGPAAGPQSQLAQNIALSWLAGARVIELKTVQVRDDLVIPRPCIDMQTVGYNVEWSQELRLEESLEEYVKASMLLRILEASGLVPLEPGARATVFDMSVGYDHAGITGGRVQAFIAGLLDATPVVDRLRRQIPPELARFRDLDFPTRIADTLTLSTFHGCPPQEIERIIDVLLRENGLHCIVKLNPMLLGAPETRRIVNDVLGYHEIRVPQSAFDRDTTWAQMCDFTGRLGDTAAACGLGFGVKFSNTLIVENHRTFFPASEREMYLSGPPLHVIAIELVRRFRRTFGDRYPMSFSAGVDAGNFADAVALGLVPVTVCSDLLKPGGYGRAFGYFQRLEERMAACGAASIDELCILSFGQATAALDRLGLDAETRLRCDRALAARAATGAGTPPPLAEAVGPDVMARWRSAAVLLNSEVYADRVPGDPRYARASNAKLPRKIGRHLKLFDCISCDKCIPVCPNDANFTFVVPRGEVPIVKARRDGAGWAWRRDGMLAITEAHQIGTFADFCNDCGNCDVFCPEDGGPYLVKPRFFGSESAWRAHAALDGFYLRGSGGSGVVLGRFAGRELRVDVEGARVRYGGPGFEVVFIVDDLEETLTGHADPGVEVDFTFSRIMLWLREGVFADGAVNYVSCLDADVAPAGGEP
jgi:putative selenate reductase